MTDHIDFDENLIYSDDTYVELDPILDEVDDEYGFEEHLLEFEHVDVDENGEIQEIHDDDEQSFVLENPEKDQCFIDLFQIEPITTAHRLTMFPEMNHLRPLRRRHLENEPPAPPALPSPPREESEVMMSRLQPVAPLTRRTSESSLSFMMTERSESLLCAECGFIFRNKASRNYHLKQHNSDEMTIPSFLCPIEHCTIRCDCQVTLNEHVRVHHGRIDVMDHLFVFPNMAEFERWKEELEDSTLSKFVRTSGKYSEYGKTTRYSCFFSSPPPRRLQSNGIRHKMSRKRERSCTAYFVVKESFSEVTARVCLVHLGHDNEPHTIPLPTIIRKEIATALVEGQSEEDIVEQFHANSTPIDRRHFIQLYEVRNISQKLLKIQNEMRENDLELIVRKYLETSAETDKIAMEEVEEEEEEVEVEDEDVEIIDTSSERDMDIIEVEDVDLDEMPPEFVIEEIVID